MDNRRYPIGLFQYKESYSPEEIKQFISIIETIPASYRLLVEDLAPEDLGRTYREGSWTIQQLIHHVSDIQLVHFFRMKKALTEPDYEVVTLINMDKWVETPDGKTAPIEDSLVSFDSITRRYVYLMKSLTDEQLAIKYYHPVRKIWFDQAQAIAISAWHTQHHLAHIKLALSDE
ncbi:YfiT family bacillithiol transferase [Larkinella terrae]|uniref:Putative metal-dependent hydrolase n=1 Tax=Larkinella terrae TaxID=2025311 RepID=A0A7K0ETK2_9BACT|nr:putative metal-dependent hydrolase [Larkinella terrae]MRS64758.1 putative metal-dependent hydrolase [Larkinella terrae]